MASTNSIQASLVPESPIGCNEYSGLQVVFRLKAPSGFPAGQITHITLFTYNNSTDISMVTFHEMVNGLTGSGFKVPSDGARPYKVSGKFTFLSGSTQTVYDFEANYDYSDLSIQFNQDPFIFHVSNQPETIEIVNPLPFFIYKWYATDDDGNVTSNLLHTGNSFNTTYLLENGNKFYVQGSNGKGCKTDAFIKRNVLYEPLTGAFELAQDCNETETAGSNPNIIIPKYSEGEIDLERITFRWYTKAQWEILLNAAVGDFDIYLAGEGVTINPQNTSLSVTNLVDNSEFTCAIFDGGRIQQVIEFTIFDHSEHYESITKIWRNKTVIFKQAENGVIPYNGAEHNKSRYYYTNAVFNNCTVKVENTKIIVLTERESFNRLTFYKGCNLEITGNSEITSSCFIWGGLHIQAANIVYLSSNSNGRPRISNANIGILIERYVVNPTSLERGENLSLAFPFYEDATTVHANSGNFTINEVDFSNNYFHIYTMAPIKFSRITACTFTCNPEVMLPPYEPKKINGVYQYTTTEAAIVGHFGFRGQRSFFETDETNSVNGCNISNNIISNAIYGILVPNLSIKLKNTYRDILICPIRYFGFTWQPYNSEVAIENQEIEYTSNFPTKELFSNQINNLDTYWNAINGFYAPSLNFDNSTNIVRFGLSTGLINHNGANLTAPVGIFVTNHERVTIPSSQQITFPNSLDVIDDSRNSIVRLKRNKFTNRAQSINSSTLTGVVSGQLSLVSENIYDNLTTAVNFDLPVNTIEKNRFINNSTGLILNPRLTSNSSPYPSYIALNCNTFETNNAPNSVGIRVKSGCPALNFGYYTDADRYSLGGNVWPTASGIDRSVQPMAGTAEVDVNLAWQSPSNWTSILNENTTTTGLVNYYRYKNEFVGRVIPISLVDYDPTTIGLRAYTSANTPPPTGSNYEAVCEGTEVTNEVYFPSTLISNNGGVGTKPTQDIEISMSANEVNIFSKGSATLNKVQVSDLLVRVVSTYSNINTKQFTLSTNLVQHGVYLIKVLDSEGKVSTSKIQR